MSALQRAITAVAIELIENKAVLAELERSFPYLYGAYYYARKRQVERRIEECEEILRKSKINWEKDAPMEQFLVIEG
jgi:hypothetical protein